MFTIKSITAKASNYLGDHGSWLVEVVVSVDAKAWTKLRDKRNLGQLYGIDISNAVYAVNKNIPAHCPTVDDRSRASKGFKTIRLSYRLSNPEAAERLGLKVMRYKNGEHAHSWGDSVSIDVPQSPRQPLKLVSNG
jgi:hypothetical protein